MASAPSFFQSAFSNMPTPAFIVSKATGEIMECNNAFHNLFDHTSYEVPANWQGLSQTSSTLEQWQHLIDNLDADKKLHIEDHIKFGQDTLDMDLELQSIDEAHILVCLYSKEHIDLAIAENHLLKFVLSESTCGFWVWEVKTDYIECSQPLCELLDCSLTDSPKSTEAWYAFVHPDDQAALKNIVDQHIAENSKNYEASYRIINSKKQSIWVKERGFAYSRDSNNNIIKSAGFIENINAQKELEEHLRRQATFDEITGLLTYAAAMTHFNKQLELAKRQYTQLSIMKIIMGTDQSENLDTFSQEDKNAIVKTTSEHLYNAIRNSDILARLSSGQLLLLLPNTNMQNAQNLLVRLTKTIEEQKLMLSDGATCHLAIRAGVATFPEDGENIEELLENANIALSTCLPQTLNVTEF
ncbi:diguanylate cyclase [Marinomonas agarivorans]|nr:diguanylate cyclase [Marinomonas agarivorans]